MRKRFYDLLSESVSKKTGNNFYLTSERYNSLLNEVKEAKSVKGKQTVHYRRLKRYDILNIGGEEKLTVPLSAEKTEILYYVNFDELFNVIHEAHIAVGHGGRTRMIKELNRKYKNVTVESIVTYLRLCEPCQKKQKTLKKGLVVKPILHNEMNSRCQVDLIDMQSSPDRDMKFILVYQDHLTKFVLLRSLHSKRADEVAYHLLDIFTTFGAPNILHSDNGREFCNQIIKSLCEMWNDIKIVHGKPRHSESQGSVERANQDVENMLATWMETNNTTKWSEGLRFVQAMKNRAYHEGIKCSPYEAMFGVPMKLGIANSVLPRNLTLNMTTEEDLEKVININNECTGDIEDEDTDHEQNLDLELQGNDNKSETETCVTMEVETEAQNEKIDPEAFSKTPDGTTATISRAQKVKVFREAAREGLQDQAKKMKATSSKKFQKPTLGQNVRIKIPDIDRAKMDPRSIIAVITDIKDEEFYELGTKLGKLKALYTRNQFTLCKENFLSIEEVGTEEISVREVVNKLSLVGGQGFRKCNCSKKCTTKLCLCKSANLLCNSKCHNSQPCCNK